MKVTHSLSQCDVAVREPSATKQRIEKRAGNDRGSSNASLPGDELPAAVYRTVIFAFVWMMLASWLAFGGTMGTDLDLAIATVLCAVLLAIPIIMHRTAYHQLPRRYEAPKRFLDSRLEIATGTMSGTEAWLQVILIPVALALAATLIGGVFVFMS